MHIAEKRQEPVSPWKVKPAPTAKTMVIHLIQDQEGYHGN